MYDFEEPVVSDFLEKTMAKRAAIQLPAGLRRYLVEIESVFKEVGVETIVLADNCYGACDLADGVAKELGCDVLIHYGHADLGLKPSLPTLFVEARIGKSPITAIGLNLLMVNFKRVGLVTTVQYIGHLREISEFLSSRGIKSIVGKPGKRAKYPGQVLGCDVNCARSIASDVDGFIYVGTGEFHPLGVAMVTGKKVLIVNPLSEDFRIIDPDNRKFLGKRKAVLAKAALAKKFGVVVSTKAGQARFSVAKKLVEMLRQKGMVAYLLAMDEITPDKIEDFGLEAFVCVACPRIPIDDSERFEKPLMTPFEVMAMLGEVPFEPYRVDELAPRELR